MSLPPQLLNLRPFPIVQALLHSQPGAQWPTVGIFNTFPPARRLSLVSASHRVPTLLRFLDSLKTTFPPLSSRSTTTTHIQHFSASTSMNMPVAVEYLTTPHERLNYEDDPVAAMSSYSRMMHYHTQQQMDAATRSARRRSSGSSEALDSSQSKLSKHNTHGSVSSRSSF